MGYLAEVASGRRPEVTAVHAPGGGTYVIEWQPKFARDASTVAASLPDDGLDLTRLVGWVIAGEAYLGQLWAGPGARRVTPSGWLWSYEAQQEMRALRAIDFFGDLGELVGPSGDLSNSSCRSSCRDPLGTQVVKRFLALLRALTAAREGQACPPCRLTIITRRAALDGRSPREALLGQRSGP